jgi:lysyl-tRNA synthetase class 2
MVERTEQEQVRFEKLAKLRAGGFHFPNSFKVNATTADFLAAPVEDAATAKRFSIAGRLVQMRHMGKAAFVHILDGVGKIQVYVKRDAIGEAAFELFKDFDIGDLVFVSGYAFVTKTGEKSVHAETVTLLTKGLIPLPEKWHGLKDVEVRYRARYVDLIANPDVRETFRKRAAIIRELRSFLDEKGYLEVETPTLHYTAGGASAKPFATFHNALSTEMHLRIALELPLKKLVVGGLERVYEIGRVFRNEGLSKKHNPEFTMLEFYQAYATFEDLMTLTEELLSRVAERVCGSKVVAYGEHQIDFTAPWPRVPMVESIYVYGGVSRELNLNVIGDVQKAAALHKVHLDEPQDWGRSIEALWGELVEHKLINPTFITHHPFSISPLARKNADNPNVTDRFELIIAGMEAANAFSELNDAQDQRERFEDQARRKAAGDEEATDIDEDFLRALEYGLPPTAGEGIGVDRLVMLLTNAPTVRDVLLFPQLKPRESTDSECEAEE